MGLCTATGWREEYPMGRVDREDEATVRALLAAAGITPPEEEILEFARSYPGLREAADALYLDEVENFLPAFFPTDADHEAT